MMATWESEQKTFLEEMEAHIKLVRDFCDGLEHQTQIPRSTASEDY